MSSVRLLRFRVQKFKSIMDSGWIDCDDVTTLVGVNEAGKSNLLLALWKLNPAKGGAIKFSDDMPVTLFSELRKAQVKPNFIEALFEVTSAATLKKISDLSGFDAEAVKLVSVAKNYDGRTTVNFPNANAYESYPANEILNLLIQYDASIKTLDIAGKTECGIKEEAEQKIEQAKTIISDKVLLARSDLLSILSIFANIDTKHLRTSKIRPQLLELHSQLSSIAKGFDKPNPSKVEGIEGIVISNLPKFVYYSNYGNLDSEIYLPHVIENMKRTDLSGIAEAKARTLKVLFEYVQLDPSEILQLGEDVTNPTDEQVKEKAERKKERDILLQSASTKLTRDFREWWNQGNYTFDFHADGKHFRIWVADNVRPERIVLENRSTGLQWFLSFYLVFLVESSDSHSGAVLLLDEAGLSLHPLAQKDLSAFFNNLSKTNQIINTTHSPFVVDTDHIDRAKVVYVNEEGYTVVSTNLRAAEKHLQTNSVYAVHAALGLTISDVLLQGCRLIIVEGPSDQFYFNAIKLYLISKNLIAPKEEILFAPSGGVKAVGSLASLLSAKGELPYVVLDADKNGQDFKAKLIKDLYKNEPSKIISLSDFLEIAEVEVEDIVPFDLLQRPLDRLFNNVDLDFSAEYDSTKSIIPQIENFAQKNGIILYEGYKVELARQFKQALRQKNEDFADSAIVDIWKNIFIRLLDG